MGHTSYVGLSKALAAPARRSGRRLALILAAVVLVASSASIPPAQAFSSSAPPPGPPSVNAGGYMTCGVRSDPGNPAVHQTGACWGNNESEGPGQATPPGGVKFSEVNAGYSHACGVRTAPGSPDDETAACWGSNVNGASTPPPGMKFSHIAPSFVYTCGLRKDTVEPDNDKTAVCWGANDAGQVSGTPAAVKFTQLTVGIRHACGLRQTPVDGNNIVCWGSNTYGQVTNVPSGTFSALNSGNFDVCALTASGAPQCWGRNAGNQSVTPPGETFTQISAGFQHVCGLRSNGTLLCWGRNTEGQALAPSGTFNNVSAGTFHSCAMGTDGGAQCWGGNDGGRVRPTMTSQPPAPAAVAGAPYSHQFTSTYMSPITWAKTSGVLPRGLRLDSATGLLDGTPTQGGTFPNITVTASNGLTSVSETFSLVVAEAGSNPPVPIVSIGDVSVHEGRTGTRAALFTLSLSEPSESTVTVEAGTTAGSAGAPADFTAKSATVSFSPGTTTAKFKVPVAGDTADEDDETFTVALSGASGVDIGDGTGLATIVDDDPSTITGRTLAIGDVSVHEGDSGSRNALFTVSLSKAHTAYVTVSFDTANGSATKPGDYTRRTGTLTFAPGVTSMTVAVAVNPDDVAEGNEFFAVNLSGAAGATVTDATGTGTIVEDD